MDLKNEMMTLKIKKCFYNKRAVNKKNCKIKITYPKLLVL